MFKKWFCLLLTVVMLVVQLPAQAGVESESFDINVFLLKNMSYTTASQWYADEGSQTMFAFTVWLEAALNGRDDIQDIISSALNQNTIYVGIQDMYSIHAYFFGQEQTCLFIYTPNLNQLTAAILEYGTSDPKIDMDNYVKGAILRSYYKVDAELILAYANTVLGS